MLGFSWAELGMVCTVALVCLKPQDVVVILRTLRQTFQLVQSTAHMYMTWLERSVLSEEENPKHPPLV